MFMAFYAMSPKFTVEYTFALIIPYWLIKVLSEDTNRRINTDFRDYLKAKAMDEWVNSLIDNKSNIIVNYLDAEKKAWAVEQAARG